MVRTAYTGLLLALFLTACSPMDLLPSFGDGPSLDVETVVGDKEEAVVGRVGDGTEVSSESITGGVNTTNIQDIPPWVMLLLVLGWLLPDPSKIYAEVNTWFRRKR